MSRKHMLICTPFSSLIITVPGLVAQIVMHITFLHNLSSLAPHSLWLWSQSIVSSVSNGKSPNNGPCARVLESPVLVRSGIVPPASLLVLVDGVFSMFLAPFQRRNPSDDYTQHTVRLSEFLRYHNTISESTATSTHQMDSHPITWPKNKLSTARAILLITVYLRFLSYDGQLYWSLAQSKRERPLFSSGFEKKKRRKNPPPYRRTIFFFSAVTFYEMTTT